ncbi:MAG: hypothetical protein GY832_26020 [Chloroflexi bacterium]|nr:hypothetical protein [Chloroflexota bacterium]
METNISYKILPDIDTVHSLPDSAVVRFIVAGGIVEVSLNCGCLDINTGSDLVSLYPQAANHVLIVANSRAEVYQKSSDPLLHGISRGG